MNFDGSVKVGIDNRMVLLMFEDLMEKLDRRSGWVVYHISEFKKLTKAHYYKSNPKRASTTQSDNFGLILQSDG